MKNEIKWYTNSDPEFKKVCPKWARSVAVDDEGNIFVPAVIWGDETTAMMCVSHDGNERMFFDSGHLYLPIEWVEREANVQGTIDVCKKIRARIKEAFYNEK